MSPLPLLFPFLTLFHLDSFSMLPISLLLSLLLSLPLCPSSAFLGFDQIWGGDAEFGCSKQSNPLSVFIISGISGAESVS